jgi:hypothetical protein
MRPPPPACARSPFYSFRSRWSSGPRPNSRVRRALHLLLLPRQTPFAIPPQHPHPHPHPHPHQQPSLRVAANHNPPNTIQPNRFAAHAAERRDLASAQATPAILGPEIGLEVRSILEHLLHATPPLNTHYLPALPPSLPMTTTPNLDLHGIPSNIRVTNRTHKSTTH